MKQIKTILLSAMLALAALTLNASAEVNVNYTDFSKEKPENWKLVDGAYVIKDGVLEVSPTANLHYLNLPSPRPTGTVVVEYDVKRNDNNSINIYLQSPAGGSICRLRVGQGNKFNFQYGTPKSDTTVADNLADVLTGEWYHVKHVINCREANANTVEGTTSSVYIYDKEGTLIGFAEDKYYMQNVKFDSRDNVSAIGVQFVQSNVGTAQLDNVAVYEKTDDSILELNAIMCAIPNAEKIEDNIELFSTPYGGATVTWKSSDTNVISDNGVVNFPSYSEGDKTVIMTAVLVSGDKTRTEDFEVKVPARMTDKEAVIIAKENFTLETDVVYDIFSLPSEYENDVDILWDVDRDDIFIISQEAENGSYSVTINRPTDADVEILLEATFKKGDKTDTATYKITVKRFIDDLKCTEIDKASIVLPEIVSDSFELPQGGTNGTVFTWSTADTDWIEIDGTTAKVKKRDTVDKTVTLTATVTKGEAEGTAEFTVIIEKDIEGNTKLLEEAVEALTLGDTSEITDDITLPETGLNETVITWETSDADVVSSRGIITRSKKTYSANLTATVTKGTLSKEKVFKITVKGTGGSSGGSGGSGGGGFGGGSSKGTTISMPTVQAPVEEAKPVPVSKFSDVSVEHWAFDYIHKLNEKNIISGMGDGLFMPEGNITREAFVKMLVTAMHGDDIEVKASAFSDVSDNDWFAKYVSFAYDKGYVMGVDENNFGTGSLITREQMAVIIARCLELKASGEADCSDKDEISDYAKDAVAALGENKIMNGDDTGAFNPKNNATRAETAKVIYELIKFLGKDR